jgi:hypothetical protein
VSSAPGRGWGGRGAPRAILSLALLAPALTGCPSPAPRSEAPPEKTFSLTLPQLPWTLELTARNFLLQKEEARPDGTGTMFQAFNPQTGVVQSAFLEQAPREGGSKVCREYYWSKAQKAPIQRKDIRLSERGDMAVVEYINLVSGETVRQKNLHGYLSKEGAWIDVHVSKTYFTEGEEGLLWEILDSLRFRIK